MDFISLLGLENARKPFTSWVAYQIQENCKYEGKRTRDNIFSQQTPSAPWKERVNITQSRSGSIREWRKGLCDRADVAAEQGATSADWGLGWDWEGEKNAGRQKLSFSDAPPVYIDWTSCWRGGG